MRIANANERQKMNAIQILKTKRLRWNAWLKVGCLFALLLLVSCVGNYGRIQRDAEVQQAFESDQIPTGYKYYYYGYDTRPYVLFGIDPKYEMDSHLWREVAPDSEELKKMVRWIWEDYGYYKFGAHIFDPRGNKVGVYYSSIHETAFKFKDDNQIVVMPHTPFLWGPPGGVSGARTP
jgi:hypothetical protein